MEPTPTTYTDLERRIAEWATRRPDIQAIVVIGSRARQDHPADEWSDLDLILFTIDVAAYTLSAAWLAELGRVWAPVLSRTGRGDPEWLVLFEGGLKADFVCVAVDTTPAALADWLLATPYQFVLARGVRILVDKGQPPSAGILGFREPPPTHPTAAALTTTVQLALLDASRVAKFLRRGDLWRAKHLCDGALKQRLLALLEWHARATHGLDFDVWHEGRFLEEWADPTTLAALPATFARYEATDVWRALFATLDLIRRLARETAAHLDYEYPTAADQQVMAWLQSLYPASH